MDHNKRMLFATAASVLLIVYLSSCSFGDNINAQEECNSQTGYYSKSKNANTNELKQDINEVVWWKKANYYHIYIRSFKDSNGDGEGDIRGVIEKLDYLKQIGVDTLLLSPFYSSPFKDIGYDIDDYEAINERFGTMQDFDDLVSGLKSRGMRLVVDFVPNHSSNKHKWFQCSERALIDPDNCGKYKDYYVWSNSTRFNNQYPSNWISIFGGGTAWQWSPIRKEFYLHQFLPEQPDLNFLHQPVRDDLKKIVRFWLRKGADGIRVDSVNFIAEDTINFPDEPENPDWRPTKDWDPYDRLLHIHTRALPLSAKIVKDWRQVADEPEFMGDRAIITEAYDPLPNLIPYYGPSPSDRYADMPFNFELLKLKKKNPGSLTEASKMQEIHYSWIQASVGLNWPKEEGAMSPWICWVTGNHDNSRLTNRVGKLLLEALKFLAYLGPGNVVNYYGDELGLSDSNFSSIPKRTLDEGEPTRLIFRAPMAWTAEEPSGGFSSSNDPWMPLNADFRQNNVENLLKPEADPKNTLKNFLQLQELRRKYLELLVFGDLVYYKSRDSKSLFSMARLHPKFGNLLLLINLDGESAQQVKLEDCEETVIEHQRSESPKRGKILMLNYLGQLKEEQEYQIPGLTLGPHQAALIEFQAESSSLGQSPGQNQGQLSSTSSCPARND